MSSNRIQTYQEFWPFYLSQHAKPATRTAHLIGSFGGAAALVAAAVTMTWWLPLAGMVFGYGAAWVSHGLIERNKPATFTYPLWSFTSDYKMFGLWATGKLEQEIAKYPQIAELAAKEHAPIDFFKKVKGLTAVFKLKSSAPVQNASHEALLSKTDPRP